MLKLNQQKDSRPTFQIELQQLEVEDAETQKTEIKIRCMQDWEKKMNENCSLVIYLFDVVIMNLL